MYKIITLITVLFINLQVVNASLFSIDMDSVKYSNKSVIFNLYLDELNEIDALYSFEGKLEYDTSRLELTKIVSNYEYTLNDSNVLKIVYTKGLFEDDLLFTLTFKEVDFKIDEITDIFMFNITGDNGSMLVAGDSPNISIKKLDNEIKNYTYKVGLYDDIHTETEISLDNNINEEEIYIYIIITITVVFSIICIAMYLELGNRKNNTQI